MHYEIKGERKTSVKSTSLTPDESDSLGKFRTVMSALKALYSALW